MSAPNLYQQARRRVETDEVLAPFADSILSDWNEGDEHLQWVIDSETEEILDWLESFDYGTQDHHYADTAPFYCD